MKSHGVWLGVLFWACGTACPAQQADLKQTVKRKVEEINAATFKGDYARVADLTHPRIVQMMGGREKMIQVMEASLKDMKAKGISFREGKVEEPSDPVAAGDELYAVVPFRLEMKVPDGKLRKKSFVIGVSGDKGKTWTFVNGDMDPEKVKQVLPNLPAKLKLPEREKPVIEKD